MRSKRITRRTSPRRGIGASAAAWDADLIDAIPQFFWTCKPDGVVDYVNRFFREHTGLTAATVHEKWTEAIHPDDLAGVAAGWQQALANGTMWEGEYRFRDVAGDYRWYLGRSIPFRDEAGRICRWLGTAADITEQKNVEQKLQEVNDSLEHRIAERTAAAEQRAVELERSERSVREQADVLRSVLASVDDGVCVSDEKGKLTLFTPAAERILGMKLFEGNMEEWSRHYGIFLPDGVTPFPVASLPLARALAGESCADVEMIIRNPGHPKGQWISATGRPLRDEAGRIRGGVVAISDITAQEGPGGNQFPPAPSRVAGRSLGGWNPAGRSGRHDSPGQHPLSAHVEHPQRSKSRHRGQQQPGSGLLSGQKPRRISETGAMALQPSRRGSAGRN